MTRQSRVESNTGIYHVMLRGINGQNIFECPEDHERFLMCPQRAKEKSGIILLGYCLMSNHAHLIIGAGTEPIGISFKRIGVSYVGWYNGKYKRRGPLFQDRFKSEPILNDAYLLSALRYIHKNPVKAGMRGKAEDYKWSSFKDYLGAKNGLVDTGMILRMFSLKAAEQINLFREFSELGGDSEDEGGFLDIDNEARPTDEALRKKMVRICGAGTVSEFQALSSDKRAASLRIMRDSGMSIRQIVRMTGMPFGIVRKI